MNSVTIKSDRDFSQQVEIDRLERNVRRRLGANVRDFRLLVHANGLILRGHASTYYAKQLAQHAIMTATSLPIVANEIEVTGLLAEAQQVLLEPPGRGP